MDMVITRWSRVVTSCRYVENRQDLLNFRWYMYTTSHVMNNPGWASVLQRVPHRWQDVVSVSDNSRVLEVFVQVVHVLDDSTSASKYGAHRWQHM